MYKLAVVLGFLVLVLPLIAQPKAPAQAVRIESLSISGVTHVSTAELQGVHDDIAASCCDQAETQEIRERILFAFQERGYFKAEAQRLEVTPLDRSTVPPSVAVAVEMSEGQQYKLKSIGFRSEKAFSRDQLREQFVIADGDIFNVEKIRKGLDDLRKLYACNGYLNFVPVPNTDADDDSAMVTLKIDVDEGKQFRLGGLLLDGEEPHAGDGAKLLETWKPMQGKVYDGCKIEQWWQVAATMLPPGSRMEQLLGLRQDAASGIVTGYLQFPDDK